MKPAIYKVSEAPSSGTFPNPFCPPLKALPGSVPLTRPLLSLQVQCVATLQVGSMQATDPSECGQCLSLAWMPTRPHHHLAAGYYNGKNQSQTEAVPLGTALCLPFGCCSIFLLFVLMLGMVERFKQCRKEGKIVLRVYLPKNESR